MTSHVPEFEGAAAVGVLVEEERVTVGRLGVVGVVSHQDLCGINIQRPFSQNQIDIKMLIYIEYHNFIEVQCKGSTQNATCSSHVP